MNCADCAECFRNLHNSFVIVPKAAELALMERAGVLFLRRLTIILTFHDGGRNHIDWRPEKNA